MGQITRLIQSDLVGGSGTDDVYPITSTTAVIQPGTNKTVEELIAAVSKQDDVRSIRNIAVVNSGRTLRFTYTDNEIMDVDFPNTVKGVSIQKDGDTNILTVTGTDGNTQVYNITEGKEYEVTAVSNNVHITRTEDTTSTPNSVTYGISVDTVSGKSAYQVAVDNGFIGTELEWLESLNGQDGTNGTNGQDGITPHIDSTSKHWMIGDTDTGVVAEGQDGSAASVTVVNNNPYVNGTTNNEEITVGSVNGTNLSFKVKSFIKPSTGTNINYISLVTQQEYDNITHTANESILYFIKAQ